MAVSAIPAGFHTITPYLTVNDPAATLSFLQATFGAELVERVNDDHGHIMHCTIQVGTSRLMMAQGSEKWPARPATFYLYVLDTDATYRKGLAAGGKSLMEPADQFYGDRNAGVEDAEGNQWWIGTHIEDVSPEEVERRAREQGR
ncbi:VOC family protein [Andreprevotia chitinilytica]|uniref:VOC family protein n=1 Tax=Andreprevotia chitinilytica TaxID=396808 RepID=UPI00054CFDCF|nr:VOC family protein [Andreprevotia chitinilytica]